ncbi:glutaredoxin family protein [Caldimonas sp. KR1-144]|uniref:glutaredoxin family protein n=1 Tax=Caldimonas sp. KR1-144 TaxID=3400911 RepID=UPI003C0E9087
MSTFFSRHRRALQWAIAAVLLLVGATAYGLWQASGRPHDLGREAAAHAQPGDIYVYSATTCGTCRKAKLWMTYHGIPYESCEIDRDADCRRRFDALGGIGTPTMVVRGQTLTGFRTELIAELVARPRVASR